MASPTTSGGGSTRSTTITRHVTGVIVRRSCMGKRLSFADIRCSSNGFAGDVDNGGSTTAAVVDDDEEVVIKVAFKRESACWNDEVSPTPFPIKTSHLPYGALVCVELLDYDPKAAGSVVYDVVTWKIIQDPKQTAESIATVGDHQNQNQHSGGLSYSTYLKERGNQFSKHTIKGQKINENYEQTRKKNNNGDSGGVVDERSNRNSNNNSNSMKRPRTTQHQQQQHLTTSDESNDDLIEGSADGGGGHGDKVVKALRAKLFAKWLLETFGSESLCGEGGGGVGVVDVAGGKGHLSIELAVTGKVPCVMIDPMIRKKHCRGDNGTAITNFPVKRDAKRIRKVGGPVPRHLPMFFNQTTFLDQYGKRRRKNNEDHESAATTTVTTEEESQEENGTGGDGTTEEEEETKDNNNISSNVVVDEYLIENCTTLIGLHPDQTTQDILEIALRYNKSVAIVPCCVFPSFFPLRQLKNGTFVNTYTQFCQYLCEMDSTLQTAVLPFAGRNVVIYRKV